MWYTEERHSNPAAARNILDNQFRLLPAGSTSSAVDTVLIFGSETLEQYYAHEFTSPYIKEIQKRHEQLRRQQETPDKIQSAIRDFVEAECKKPGFHHVLTELAFLQVSKDGPHTDHCIIPIVLSGNDLQYLPFVKNCDVFLKHESESKNLFFKLLKKVFTDTGQPAVIDKIEECYKSLERRNIITDQDLQTGVTNAIGAIGRHRSATSREQDRRINSAACREQDRRGNSKLLIVRRETNLQQLLDRILPSANPDAC